MDIKRFSFDMVKRMIGKKVTVTNHDFLECEKIQTIKEVLFGNRIKFKLSSGIILSSDKFELIPIKKKKRLK